MLPSLFRRLFNSPGAAVASRTQTFRPRLEKLEDRQLLSNGIGVHTPYDRGVFATTTQGSHPTAEIPVIAPSPAAASAQNTHDALGRLWNVISLTKNALQAPWLSRQFGQGNDATALLGDPTYCSMDRMDISWDRVMAARPLIVQAVTLFEAAQKSTGQAETDLVHRGNMLLQQAGELVQVAEQLWSEMWSESWQRPNSSAHNPAPAVRPRSGDGLIGANAPAQAQGSLSATKVVDIPWAGKKWYIYETPGEYKRLTNRTYVLPAGVGAITFPDPNGSGNIITVFASRQYMQNPGLYAHERAHMLIFTESRYSDMLDDPNLSPEQRVWRQALREQYAYIAGFNAAKDNRTKNSQQAGLDELKDFFAKGSKVYTFVAGQQWAWCCGQLIDITPRK